ncbi:hypothetical protein F5B21DRAFT_461740, partial [Xylaria acuta]
NLKKFKKKRTTPGIRWSSPTQLLIWRSLAYLGQSRRDAEFSRGYGRTWEIRRLSCVMNIHSSKLATGSRSVQLRACGKNCRSRPANQSRRVKVTALKKVSTIIV